MTPVRDAVLAITAIRSGRSLSGVNPSRVTGCRHGRPSGDRAIFLQKV